MNEEEYLREKVLKMEDQVEQLNRTLNDLNLTLQGFKDMPELITDISKKHYELSERVLKVELETQINTNSRVDFKQLIFGVISGVTIAFLCTYFIK